jgi:hypothetical protein
VGRQRDQVQTHGVNGVAAEKQLGDAKSQERHKTEIDQKTEGHRLDVLEGFKHFFQLNVDHHRENHEQQNWQDQGFKVPDLLIIAIGQAQGHGGQDKIQKLASYKRECSQHIDVVSFQSPRFTQAIPK